MNAWWMQFQLALTVCAVVCQGADAQRERQLVFNNGVVSVSDDINIPALDSGRLVVINVRLGQRVKAGESLGFLDSEDLEAEREVLVIEQKLAEITARNDINIRFSERSSEVSGKVLEMSRRANQLYTGTVGATEIDRLRLEAERGELSIERSVLDIETAETEVLLQEKRLLALSVRIKNRQIICPADGIVVSAPFSAGEWVERGQSVARIIDTKRVEVVALGEADQVDEILVGKRVSIDHFGEKNIDLRMLDGTVTYVAPEINPASGQVQIRAEIDNPDGILRPGSRVKMVIELD